MIHMRREAQVRIGVRGKLPSTVCISISAAPALVTCTGSVRIGTQSGTLPAPRDLSLQATAATGVLAMHHGQAEIVGSVREWCMSLPTEMQWRLPMSLLRPLDALSTDKGATDSCLIQCHVINLKRRPDKVRNDTEKMAVLCLSRDDDTFWF